MTTRREESDGRTVPEGRRKAAPTVPAGTEEGTADRGGRATTASESAMQLDLLPGSAEAPRGTTRRGGGDRSPPRAVVASMPGSATGGALPPMTMEEVADDDNLRWAWRRVADNDGAAGPDRQSVSQVREHLDEVLGQLRRSLLDGSYEPGLVRRVWIPKAGGGQRGLGIPNVVDRIVQQAVLQVLSPHYEPTFHGSSHGFRPGRSCHSAIAEAKSYVEEGLEWVVDLDLEKFFDRVHHDRLMARLGERIGDRSLLRLIGRMLRAKVVMPDGVVVSTMEGTPQGGPLSPLLSNIVLDELDRELARRGHRFVRYADDCNIYVRSERAGQRVMASVVHFIERKLRLKVNLQKSAVARPEERHFVGFRLRREPSSGDAEVLLSKRSKERIDAKIRELTPRTWGRSMSACIQRANAYLRGWVGFFWICTEGEERTLEFLDAHLRRRLRAIQLRQWKRSSTIIKRLVQLGVKPDKARASVNKEHRSWWRLSHAWAVDRGLNRAYFSRVGLLSLVDLNYQRHARARVTVQAQQQWAW